MAHPSVEAVVAEIVVVSSWAPNLVMFRGPLIADLIAQGHRVVAMAPEATPPDALLALGARYVPLPMDRAGTQAGTDLVTVGRFVRRLRRIRPDAVLLYNPKPVIYGSLAAWLAGVPRVYPVITGLGYLFMPDGTVQQRVVQTIARQLYRAAMRRVTTVFVQNPDDHNDLVSAGILSPGQRVVRVHGSGVDLEQFHRAPPPSGPPTFLFVGRMLRDKGVHEFVEAAKRVRKTHPRTRFQLLGPLDANPSGLSQSELDRLVADGTVEYLGVTDDVRPYLRACSVLVLPSYREGTPRSVLEALATGRAVITTDSPGCRETVDDGVNGLLVPPRDAAALAQAMQTLADDPDRVRRMGREGRALAEEWYDVRRVNAAMMAEMGLSTSGVRHAA